MVLINNNNRMSISSYASFASLRSTSRASSVSWSSSRSSRSDSSTASLGSSLYSDSTIVSPLYTRVLSTIEKSRAYHNVLNMPTSIAVVAGTYSQPITRDNLFPALADLIYSEPMLGVNIFGTNKRNLQLTKIDSFNLEEIITFDPTESLRGFLTTISERVSLPYDRTDVPLWRVYVLSEYELAFVFDRGCFDEHSGVYFHKKLIRRMAFPNKLALRRENWVVETSPLAIPESLDELMAIKPVKQSHFKGILKMNKQKNLWSGPDIRSSKSTGSTLVFEIPALFVRRLMANVKHRGITMTSVFYAALMQCVLEYTPSHVLHDELELQTTTPVNARCLLRSKLNEEVLGNFSLDINYSLSNFASSVRPWTFADRWAKNFNTYLTSSASSPESLRRSALSTPSIWNTTEDMKKRVQSMAKKPRENLIEINNLGHISLGKRSVNAELTLNKLTFSQPSTVHNNSLGCGYSLNVISLDNGPAVFTLSIANDDKTNTTARKIRDSFLSVLSNVLET